MRFVVFALGFIFYQGSFAAEPSSYFCEYLPVPGEVRSPAPTVNIRVLEKRSGGNSVLVALQEPASPLGSRFFKEKRCPQEDPSKPDYNCRFPGYRVGIGLAANRFPERVNIGRIGQRIALRPWRLTCKAK